ncbi:kinase-like domain-containing protein [Boletus edulis]|nr:kinase-like domain-containing protein [Boletus edulis]
MSVAPYPSAAPHAAIPYGQSLLTSDEIIKKRCTDSDRKLRNAMSRTRFPTPEHGQECSAFVERLRLHRNLFMHTYVHLVSCCRGRYLHQLVDEANRWRWGSVQQLIHHSLIRERLLSFWQEHPCHEHRALRDQHFQIGDDDSDLLCLLLYCGKKEEMYELSNKPAIRGHVLPEFEQVVELLWKFLTKPQEIHDLRRLRAFIYRMARKSAYLPDALRIAHPSISRRRDLGPGAHGLVTRAIMNGQDVVIKKIVCSDPAAQRKCLEMFASEAILWGTLRHKNIVPFLGVVMEDTFNMGLVSPFFKYGSIRNYLKGRNPREWPGLARKWARDLAEALAYIHCHEPPIIHGDLKGDNVLVDDSGNACLADFGQSYASDSGKFLDSTRVGLVAYNPVYWMAPELIEADDYAKASDKSDIYAFGCVLYEMMSGKVPFEGLAFGDVVKCVRDDRPLARPASIHENDPLWTITTSCRRSHAEARPSATHLVSRLR